MLVLAIGLLASGLSVTAAVAAKAHHGISPRHGQTYRGQFTGGGVLKVVSLKISQNGNSGDASMLCNGVPFGGHIHMPIVNGAFQGKHVFKGLVSSITIWTMKGHFTSKTQARVNVGLPDNCDGHGGNVTLTVT
jgi:hypothetical protein